MCAPVTAGTLEKWRGDADTFYRSNVQFAKAYKGYVDPSFYLMQSGHVPACVYCELAPPNDHCVPGASGFGGGGLKES